MKYDYGHWEGGGKQGSESSLAPDDAFENHQFRVHQGPHKGGVHGMMVHEHNPGEHCASDMSQVANSYLKLLG